jgi:hypothetical protein
MRKFNTKDDFIEFLAKRPEKGKLFNDIDLNSPYDLSFQDYDLFEALAITFDKYKNFHLLIHPKTNELVLGNINTAGHTARCRIVKIERNDIFNRPESIRNWYDNWAWEIWK